MKKQSVKINLIFQILYQLVMFLIPMITAPYLTRVLGSDNLGTYTFSYSIAYYFVLFASLGISKHGQRIIAERKENNVLLRKTFWSLYFIHSVFSIIAIIAYLIFVFSVKNDSIVYLFQSLYVCSALFDITWLFYGLEDFRTVVIKNFIIKILSTLCLFIFVKTNTDLIAYTIIMSGSILLGQIVMMPEAIRMIKPIKFSWGDCKEHFKPLFVLSIAVVAVTLYTVFDKTLIGVFVDKSNVAYYEYADKIIRIPLTIISVIGTVIYPRACLCFAKNDIAGLNKYFKYSLIFSYFIGCGSAVGLVSISDLFTVVYYGEGFAECSNMIKAMTPLILIVSLGDIVRMQYLIPMKKDIQYTFILVINATINLSISIFLLSKIGTFGAIIGTLCAELFGLIAEMFLCKKYVDFKLVFFYLIPGVISALGMFLTIYILKIYIDESAVHLLVQILVGGLVYTLLFFALAKVFIKDLWKELMASIKKLFNKAKSV